VNNGVTAGYKASSTLTYLGSALWTLLGNPLASHCNRIVSDACL